MNSGARRVRAATRSVNVSGQAWLTTGISNYPRIRSMAVRARSRQLAGPSGIRTRQGGPVRAVRVADGPPELLASGAQRGSGSVQSVITPIQGDQFSCAQLVGRHQVLALLLVRDAVPGVRRVDLVGGPAELEQPDLLGGVAVRRP